MRSVKLTTWVCILVSAACLVAAYALAGDWLVLLLFLAILLCWRLIRKRYSDVTLSISLVVYILFVLVGLLAHLSPYLMIMGCSFALAGWEMLLFSHNSNGAEARPGNLHLENRHLQDLALATGFGLTLAGLGLNLHLHLPFGLVVFMVLLTGFGLFRLQRYIVK